VDVVKRDGALCGQREQSHVNGKIYFGIASEKKEGQLGEWYFDY